MREGVAGRVFGILIPEITSNEVRAIVNSLSPVSRFPEMLKISQPGRLIIRPEKSMIRCGADGFRFVAGASRYSVCVAFKTGVSAAYHLFAIFFAP